MLHIVGNLLMMATTLLQNSPQLKVCTRSYGFQSPGSSNFENFETPNLGIPRQNDIWVQASWPSIENIIRGKVVAPPNQGCDESYEFVYTNGSFVHQKCSNYALTCCFLVCTS
jgi:hypothetical protein